MAQSPPNPYLPRHPLSVPTSGYAHAAYARALSEFGTPYKLPQCGSWVLLRPIQDSSYLDAMGCYPLFTCQDWSKLYEDLETLNGKIVSLALVTDPFGNYEVAELQRCFGDIVIPFKEHFVVDLSSRFETPISKTHRYNTRRSLKTLTIEQCEKPIEMLDEWTSLYDVLIARHHITGISAFSRESFAKQLEVPGIIGFRAKLAGKTVGAHLWYIQGEIAYYHLAAFNQEGYEHLASYGLVWHAMHCFAQRGVRWLALGAGAGTQDRKDDGLSRFKRGWATGTRTAYFCGRIFDPDKYAELVQAREIETADFFPLYRAAVDSSPSNFVKNSDLGWAALLWLSQMTTTYLGVPTH